MTFSNWFRRVPRADQGPPLAGYPPAVRRALYWYDSLSDWQRIQYAVVAILFLLACGGYLLGLGSAIVLARVESEQAPLAAEPLPTEEPTATATALPEVATVAPMLTSVPSPTRVPPTPEPTQTPFSGPVIAEPPAFPREVPAAPAVIAPVAPSQPAPRAAPTSPKPRNLENTQPEPPAASLATPTPAVVRSVRTSLPTAVRQAPVAPTSRADVATPAPTAPRRVAPTTAPTTAPTRAPAQATPARTPAGR